MSAAVPRRFTAPRRPLPDGAWDCHAHVFGPFDRYPLAPSPRYEPPLAPANDHALMLRTAGFSNGLLVHGSAHGFDNRATLDAIAAASQHLRGCGVVPLGTGPGVLLHLGEAGVRALRFTETGETMGVAQPAEGMLGLDALRSFAPLLRQFGWHAQLWARCSHIAKSATWLSELGIPLVVDHMGMFDVERGVRDDGFQTLLSLAAEGLAWVKLTPLRVTRRRWNDCADVRPFHDALVEHAPSQLLWGSDWPYIRLDADLPDVGAQLDLFEDWTGDDDLRRQVLVDNPARLFNLPPAPTPRLPPA